MEEKTLVIGLDLGGTHTYAGVVDSTGEILVKKEADINLDHEADVIIQETIIPIIREAMDHNPGYTGNIRALGMGIPGNHDSKRGICFFSPNFRWRNVSLVPPIQEALGLPVFMLNDVRCAALGEKHFGSGSGVPDFVMCAIGTGVGGGVVADGRLILGQHESAGEIGHITIVPDGARCNCGNIGCLEAYVSGPNIARRTREAMMANRDSKLWEIQPDVNSAEALHLYQAATQGDETALKVWEETGRYLAIGFASIIHTINPRRFIIGGRVANALRFFLPALREELNRRATMVPPDSVEIVQAGLKEHAGMIGAAALAFEKIGAF